MMRICTLGAGITALLFGTTVLAADPASGTISESSPELSYTFAAAPAPNVSGLVETNYMCDVTFPCDEFELTLDLPDDWVDEYPFSSVRVAAATDVEYLDIDLQVSDTDGNVLYNFRDNPPEQPTLHIYPNGGPETYIVQVVPGTPHSGGSVVITLIPGDPAKSGVLGVVGSFGAGALILLALAGLGRRAVRKG